MTENFAEQFAAPGTEYRGIPFWSWNGKLEPEKLRRQIRSRYRATCVIVAQRISSIRHAEHILVLEEGRCLGYGTHEELLRDCPLYREIYQIQMGDGSTPAPEGGDQHAAHQ